MRQRVGVEVVSFWGIAQGNVEIGIAQFHALHIDKFIYPVDGVGLSHEFFGFAFDACIGYVAFRVDVQSVGSETVDHGFTLQQRPHFHV